MKFVKFIKFFLNISLFVPFAFAGNEDFSHQDFSFKHFTNERLCRCNFYRTNLYYSRFIRSTLKEVKFIETRMRFSDLHHAKFDQNIFQAAKLMNSKIYETDLNDSDFTEADLTGSDLHGSDLSKCNFTNAKLRYAKLYEVKIKGAIVGGADFRGAYGLTNKQKKYLRKNNAINVPVDIEYDLDPEIEKYKEVFDPNDLGLWDAIRRPFKQWFKYHFQSEDAMVQKDNVFELEEE